MIFNSNPPTWSSNITTNSIDRSFPWDYFDGSSFARGAWEGGFVFYLTQNHFFKLKSGMGQGKNIFSQLMRLKLLILFSIEKVVWRIYILGDSNIGINWFNDTYRCHMHIICPIIEEIYLLKQYFHYITCCHILIQIGS